MAYAVPATYGNGQSFVDLFADTLPGFDNEPSFELFDPRGLFAAQNSGCDLPLSRPSSAAKQLGQKSGEEKLRDAVGTGLPALRIPGTQTRTDHDRGFSEHDPFRRDYRAREAVEGMGVPGLARSASSEAVSPVDSVPGTPASIHEPLIDSPLSIGVSPRPRGRTELRRVLLNAQHATSQSPCGRPQNEAEMPDSTLFSSPSPSHDTNLRRRRIEQSPGAESIGSDAYSDMMMSPAVSFLSAFAENTNMSAAFSALDAPRDDLEQGDEVAGYKIGQVVGKGTYSTVRECIRLIDGAQVAVKIIPNMLDPSSSLAHLPSNTRGHTGDSSLAAFAFRDRSCSTPAPVKSSLLRSVADPFSSSLPMAGHQPSAPSTEFLERELSIWSQIGCHPNILPMLGVHRNPTRTYVFMPLCSGGNLLQLLNENGGRSLKRRNTEPPARGRSARATLSRDQAISTGLDIPHSRHIFAQIVKGLEYLHIEAGVTHKDLKLENILVDDGVFRIADFGLAHAMSQEAEHEYTNSSALRDESVMSEGRYALPRIREATWPAENADALGAELRAIPRRSGTASEGLPSFAQAMPVPSYDTVPPAYDVAAGSLPYTTPEQLRSISPIFDPSADIWALGCILYALLDGQLPFHDDFEPRLRMKILRGEWETPKILHNKSVGECRVAEIVLKGCLDVDPSQRWTIQQVSNSEWLGGDGDGRGRSRHRMNLRRLGSYGNYGQVEDCGLTSTSPSRSRSKSRNQNGQAISKQLCLDGTEVLCTPATSPCFNSPTFDLGGATTYLGRGRSRDRRNPVVTGRTCSASSGLERRSAISPSHSRSASHHKRNTFRN